MIRITSTLFLILFSTHASAISDAQFESVRALGMLNGVALNCGYIDETRRMKRSLVATVPKLRVIGQAFDDSTNDAFLEMVNNRTNCPSERTLSEQVDHSIQQVEEKFPATPLLPKP